MEEKFGTWLKTKLKEKRIKQSDFAFNIGIATGSVQNYISGHRLPSSEMFLRITDALELDEKEYDEVEAAVIEEKKEKGISTDRIPRKHFSKTTTEQFSFWLIDILRSSGLTQREFASKIGVSATHLHNYVSGHYMPNFPVLKKIADLTPYSVEAIAAAFKYPDFINVDKILSSKDKNDVMNIRNTALSRVRKHNEAVQDFSEPVDTDLDHCDICACIAKAISERINDAEVSVTSDENGIYMNVSLGGCSTEASITVSGIADIVVNKIKNSVSLKGEG